MSPSEFRVTSDIMASHGQRLGNYLLDFIFQVVIIFLLSFGIALVAVLMGNQAIVDGMAGINLIQQYLIGACIVVVYYGLTESFFSRSFGKFITKTIVVMEDGTPPDQSVILKRAFCRLIPFDNFSFLFSTPPRGWHDSFSNTYVVDKELFEESVRLFNARQKNRDEN